MSKDSTLEDHPGGKTLRDKPGEVDCGVDADGCIGEGGVDAGRSFRGGMLPELGSGSQS